jgi:hypothetical protein
LNPIQKKKKREKKRNDVKDTRNGLDEEKKTERKVKPTND